MCPGWRYPADKACIVRNLGSYPRESRIRRARDRTGTPCANRTAAFFVILFVNTNSSSTVSVAVTEFAGQVADLWSKSSPNFPLFFERCYTRNEQQGHEELLDHSLERIDRELHVTRTRVDTERMLGRLASTVVKMALCALELENPRIESLLRDGFSQVSIDLARDARKLDHGVSFANILQACRNAWTACGLQLLFGESLRLTPAIFAYSMLYPYSDNYLDSAAVSSEAKLRFNTRFRRRLQGELLPAAGDREAIVWQLVGLIESEYPRTSYPEVYDSLLAIHTAQEQSLRQMRKNPPEGGANILALSVAKGGASVLADAYLVRGTLSAVEAAFAFEWGVLLQLSDDLQDVGQDRRTRSVTLFSQAAARQPLDELTNRTFHFGQQIMNRMERLPNASQDSRELLRKSWCSLLLRSAANVPELYTSAYLAELEIYSPFRFAFLRKREQRLARRTRRYVGALEALLRGMNSSTGLMLPDRGPELSFRVPLEL